VICPEEGESAPRAEVADAVFSLSQKATVFYAPFRVLQLANRYIDGPFSQEVFHTS